MLGLAFHTKKQSHKSLPFATRLDLEGILLTEISPTEKDKHGMISRLCGIRKSETHRETEAGMMVARGWAGGGGDGEILVEGHRPPVRG